MSRLVCAISRVMPSARAAVFLWVCCAVPCFALPGTVLLKYDSALGTLPHRQGWTYESHCLCANCPANPVGVECKHQGADGNDCRLGHGCGPNATPALDSEHYNAPTQPLGVSGACSYTEWIAFDDGEDYLASGYPVPLPHRNLTFGSATPATAWGPHAHPAFGAPGFVRAPVGHNAVRIVTGGGVPNVVTLPATLGNNRNLGRLDIRGTYTLPVGVTAVTLVAKLAAGNRSAYMEMVQFTGAGRLFSLGVDGVDGSATLGRFTSGTGSSPSFAPFGTRTVAVALARANVWGPHQGEFFIVRIVLRSDGTVKAWLNEDLASAWTGTSGTSGTSTVQFQPDEQAGTMWLDYAQVLEGEVPPPTCSDPTFDVNHDYRVDTLDLGNGVNGFIDCATGSAPPPGAFDALSDACKCHDANADRAVDMRDFALFQLCLTAGNAPLVPGCDD